MEGHGSMIEQESKAEGEPAFVDLRSSILDPRSSVLDLYRAVDAEVRAAGPVCVASGRCCRFKEYGHTLFVSNLEAEVLLASAPPFDGPITPDFCPFQKGNLCTAREPRPLGCRVYYCDPNYQETGNALTEKYLHQLKRIAEEQGVAWRYAPLHAFLAEALAARTPLPLILPPSPLGGEGPGARGDGSD